jgi:hypothetical protein
MLRRGHDPVTMASRLVGKAIPSGALLATCGVVARRPSGRVAVWPRILHTVLRLVYAVRNCVMARCSQARLLATKASATPPKAVATAATATLTRRSAARVCRFS